MASLQKDPSGNYHISIPFGGRRFKRSLKTSSQRKASAACARVQENISLIEMGRIELPDNVDLPTFLLSDTKLNHKPKLKAGIRLGRWSAYLFLVHVI